MKTPLPHGAEIDSEKRIIAINLGSVHLKFSFDEWDDFIEMIADIDTIFQSNLKVDSYACPSCGSETNSYEYNEPTEEEYN